MDKVSAHLPQLIIAVLFVAIFGGCVYFAFTLEAISIWSETQENIAIYLLGILSAVLVQIANYFFGSSAGSKEKTAALGLK